MDSMDDFRDYLIRVSEHRFITVESGQVHRRQMERLDFLVIT